MKLRLLAESDVVRGERKKVFKALGFGFEIVIRLQSFEILLRGLIPLSGLFQPVGVRLTVDAVEKVFRDVRSMGQAVV